LGFLYFSECVKPRQRVLRINNANVFSSHPIKSGVKTRKSDEIKPGVDILNRANADVGSAERQIVTQSRFYSLLRRKKTNSTVQSRRCRFLHLLSFRHSALPTFFFSFFIFKRRGVVIKTIRRADGITREE
jgi:hypothetical protein